MAYQNEQTASPHVPHDSGLSISSSTEGAVKIKELESEVQFLTERATDASQRFAEYENEIRVLQAELRQEQRRNAKAGEAAEGTQPASSAEKPGISRFGSFMGSRKTSPGQQNGIAHAPSPREKDLESALVKEQTARIAAEKKVKEVNAEVEELSATLFQQANEMVASERKENAALKDKLLAMDMAQRQQNSTEFLQHENMRLKERIKVLEQREADRKRRLEKLEAAIRRTDRVKTLLIPR